MSAAPYRADHVGSLLRPAIIKTAHEKFEEKSISAAEMRAAEDEGVPRP